MSVNGSLMYNEVIGGRTINKLTLILPKEQIS